MKEGSDSGERQKIKIKSGRARKKLSADKTDLRTVARGLTWGEAEGVLAELQRTAFSLNSFSVLQFNFCENVLYLWVRARMERTKEAENQFIFNERVCEILEERENFMEVYLNESAGAFC